MRALCVSLSKRIKSDSSGRQSQNPLQLFVKPDGVRLVAANIWSLSGEKQEEARASRVLSTKRWWDQGLLHTNTILSVLCAFALYRSFTHSCIDGTGCHMQGTNYSSVWELIINERAALGVVNHCLWSAYGNPLLQCCVNNMQLAYFEKSCWV